LGRGRKVVYRECAGFGFPARPPISGITQPGWPGLYFPGFFNLDTALNMVFEHQSRWIRDIELGEGRVLQGGVVRQDRFGLPLCIVHVPSLGERHS